MLTPFGIAQMARTQKNKATAGHLGLLKAKLAKLRRELINPKGGTGGGTGEGEQWIFYLFYDLEHITYWYCIL